MNQPTVSIIVALAKKNKLIGKNNKLPWHITGDLKHFKKITYDHPIIMGRKTYESIGKPLPNRINIVVSRNKNYSVPPDCFVVPSLQEAIDLAKEKDLIEIFIIGGGQIFRQAMLVADKIYLTLVEGDFEGDVYFPEYESLFKKVLSRSEHESSGYKYTFLTLAK
ncbi:hypothetical protein A3A93_04815 [Candidatus Roizmanbacteria bacterium RIFCSPLOWO2_01_FULL_38_12]|uniref:Dihydrofolate reductase n=1 Tax=Candidatus Roizmanbacteria bacterium RIFCSPLOWO2_01_FULL_38_12 TaxID=1802061 RepID=A0A1F7IVX8_9BACT|nr:MAG: hypothetical protein A3F59_06065 [Candidatus Roizmanbacteria bacterium RIFCSPHIGHO2_12_FULL_38_13]OGK47530.1 MAG: hypothetical protein A3A93_04815 [Candidatus Roizmanbacteria bacterium RIFCSPLOWO2_01_FULL_38_12]